MKSQEIWFVAAGTGGHIYPGLTLARELTRVLPQLHPVFWGTRDRLEARLVPEAGFDLRFVRAGRWKGMGPLARVGALLDLSLGLVQALRDVWRAPPAALVSVGGYVSLPLAMACLARGVPVFLLEPNIIAGVSNRLVSRWARLAFCSPGANAKRVLKCPVLELGTPVRPIAPAIIREHVRRVLVLGGSQGALKVCEGVLRAAAQLRSEVPNLRFVVQCGPRNMAAARSLHSTLGLGAEVELLDYIQDVPAALAESDVVVARAGAMTVTELSMSGHPTIFIPFPYAADDHQRYNAALLADDGAARLLLETEAAYAVNLLQELRQLCVLPGHFERRIRLSERLRRWGRPQATQAITRSLVNSVVSLGRL